MILDLHVHSKFSGDSPVEPEEYAQHMLKLKDDYRLDGFVLMEHNHLVTAEECDLAALSEQYGLVILAGVEVDTFWGHILAYGMSEEFWASLNSNGARKQEPLAFAEAAQREGVLLAPSHPFRGWIGLGDRSRELPGLCAVEGLNGSDTDLENLGAMKLAKRMRWAALGGSDAHFLAELGNGLTEFERPVHTMAELMEEIRAGRCRPLKRDDARIL